MDTVYHYTSPQGAFDILRNKTLRFTDCQYLNDMGEFVYVREPLKEAYNKIRSEGNEETHNTDNFLDSFFLSPFEDFHSRPDRRSKSGLFSIGWPSYLRYFVLCASENADNINMWNYYVKDGAYRGYNLGLRPNVIQEYFEQMGNSSITIKSGSVIYDRALQIDMFYDKLKELISKFDQQISTLAKGADDSPAIDEFQDSLSEYINEQKLFFKNPGIASEREYRFVLKIRTDFSESYDQRTRKGFRVGSNGVIIPYIEWSFGDDLKSTLLDQITLSPMIEPELAEESFKQFLTSDVYRNIKIQPSSLKLRY